MVIPVDADKVDLADGLLAADAAGVRPNVGVGQGVPEGKGSAKIGWISRNLAEHFHSSVGTDPKKWDPGITALVTDS